MKESKTTVKALRSKYWEKLQELANELEEGNLNHLCNKAFNHYISFIERGKKKKNKISLCELS